MSYRLHRHATWRDDFRDYREQVTDEENSRKSTIVVKQTCRDAVARGDRSLLDRIQSSEKGLDQFIDKCRREITG